MTTRTTRASHAKPAPKASRSNEQGNGDGAQNQVPYQTRNDLPLATRAEVIALLNQRLADSIDLQTQCKQAHWNVKGPTFIALHKLFDEVYADVEGYVDLIAERVVQLGGMAEGTARLVAQRSTLLDYPVTLSTAEEHVTALSDALAQFGREIRMGIEEMNDLEDAGSADILTEISRGVDKWLWFVESHGQGTPVTEQMENAKVR